MIDPIVLIPISLIFIGCVLAARHVLVRRRLLCPRTGTMADVSVLQRTHHPDTLVRVKRCSLLPNPKRVDCGQACLRQPA